jgi:hypothetical protein
LLYSVKSKSILKLFGITIITSRTAIELFSIESNVNLRFLLPSVGITTEILFKFLIKEK